MKRDPIVEEVRRARESLFMQYDNDIRKLIEAMTKQQLPEGSQAVSLPPKRISKRSGGRRSA
jgi:hypothetical protein